jgi:hypothetical protein
MSDECNDKFLLSLIRMLISGWNNGCLVIVL